MEKFARLAWALWLKSGVIRHHCHFVFHACCLPWIVTSQLSGSAALAAARKSGNALGLLPQAMALALAMGRKPMPPTRPGVSIIGPLFFRRAARDLVGRLTRQRARFAAIPHAMACFGAPAHDTWVARGEHHEHPAHAAARQAPAGASRCFRRSGGAPEGLKLVPARAQ